MSPPVGLTGLAVLDTGFGRTLIRFRQRLRLSRQRLFLATDKHREVLVVGTVGSPVFGDGNPFGVGIAIRHQGDRDLRGRAVAFLG